MLQNPLRNLSLASPPAPQETAEKFRLEAQAAKQAAQQARLAEQQAKAAMLKVRQRAEEACGDL